MNYKNKNKYIYLFILNDDHQMYSTFEHACTNATGLTWERPWLKKLLTNDQIHKRFWNISQRTGHVFKDHIFWNSERFSKMAPATDQERGNLFPELHLVKAQLPPNKWIFPARDIFVFLTSMNNNWTLYS